MSIDNLEKLNYNIPLVSSDVVGVPTNGDNVNTAYHTQGSLKRPRTEDYSEIGMYSSNKLSNYICSDSRSYSRAKTFLTVRHNNYIYHTEEWKPKGCTMYLPLSDEKGNYVGAKPGNAVHLWRFDPASRKLYISRSILFLKEQDYQDVQFQLDNL
ncbi:uncharacterized protein CEXT_805832 [Caerostris extrusa]|uniref:Uncharacterized protein n=1 Tax=Caerostris extrusa TaxID=172846 RepID=A0AAV4Y963_CAEEX|nr:uncharacterized protein CEXT_805832 [Caerostris extrusa]